MFDHVTIRVSDRAASERFYSTVLEVLDLSVGGEFRIAGAGPVTRRLHVGFRARSRAEVDEFWRVGTGAGYRSDGEPGPRPQYTPDYYGSFLLDPDGNSIEAVVHQNVRTSGAIDHMWIRVRDARESARFYAAIAPAAGFRLAMEAENHVRFADGDGSFSVRTGEPTRNLHMAFPASDDATVREFHRLAVAAGYRSEGEPGERPEHHPGYYAAFTLDPDGNVIEVVNHNRG